MNISRGHSKSNNFAHSFDFHCFINFAPPKKSIYRRWFLFSVSYWGWALARSVRESALNVPIFSSGAQECPKCVLTSLTRKISMRSRCKHSHGVLHRVPRFIELSLYLPSNIYTCGMECIEPLLFTLGWHLATDKIYFLYLWWSSEHFGRVFSRCLGSLWKLIVLALFP